MVEVLVLSAVTGEVASTVIGAQPKSSLDEELKKLL